MSIHSNCALYRYFILEVKGLLFSTTVGPTDWATVITAMTGQISITTIIAVLASLVATGIGLVFMWWGVRKAARSLMAAFRKGKMSL